MQLHGAKALVTGAAQGLGKAFSEALLRRGASVCISDVQLKKGKATENEFQEKYGKDKAMFIECDVRSKESLSSMFKEAVSRFGHIDLMVNNAGIGDETRLEDMTDINLLAVIRGTELAVKHMRKDQGGKGGTVINISSIAGVVPVYVFPKYVATKFGVLGFTEAWAGNPHLIKMGIQLACLCPAFAKTAIIEFEGKQEDYLEEAKALLQLVGINEVENVTQAFMQLVDSDNCNGDTMIVSKNDGIVYRRKNGKRVKPKL